MESVEEALLGLVGLALIVAVVDSAVRTFVLPRGVLSLLTRSVFVGLRKIFELVIRPMNTYEARDNAMALYGPSALMVLVGVWLVLVIVGFAFLFRAFVVTGWGDAFKLGGSSIFTLGFAAPPDGLLGYTLTFVGAASGLALLALLIGYLPTIYGAFSRREVEVARLATRAGTPPSGGEMLERYHAVGWLDELPRLWGEWEVWFSELAETHTTFSILAYFRSPNPHRSWVTSAGAILDGAALAQSTLSVPWSPQAGMCIRAGYLALRDIAGLAGVAFDADPAPDAPISIAREEFLEAYERLGGAGVPVRPDRERAWRDFAGWRVNYDAVLLGLAGMTTAPYAPWSSDRSLSRVRTRRGLRRR